jgi:hypothetical protein
MKLKIKKKKRPWCMYVHIYILRKLQRISLIFFLIFCKKKKKKKNFSDVALFATSENSDVLNSEMSEFSDVSLFTTSNFFFFCFFFFSLLFSSRYLVKNFI